MCPINTTKSSNNVRDSSAFVDDILNAIPHGNDVDVLFYDTQAETDLEIA